MWLRNSQRESRHGLHGRKKSAFEPILPGRVRSLRFASAAASRIGPLSALPPMASQTQRPLPIVRTAVTAHIARSTPSVDRLARCGSRIKGAESFLAARLAHRLPPKHASIPHFIHAAILVLTSFSSERVSVGLLRTKACAHARNRPVGSAYCWFAKAPRSIQSSSE